MNTVAKPGSPAQARPPGGCPTALALLLATIALALGAAVYALARAPQGAWLWPAAWTASTVPHGSLPPALQLCLGSLPSAVHGFAFALLSLVLLAPRPVPAHQAGQVRARAWGVCALWCLVGLLFEAGQHPHLAQGVANLLRGADAHARWLQAVARYFTRGTFDVLDLAATVAGCAAAARVWLGAGQGQDQSGSKA